MVFSQNVDTSSDGIIKKTEEFVLTFVPHYLHPTQGLADAHLIKADGSVIASFSQYTYVDAVFSNGYKINISTKKKVKNGVYLSGGLVTEDNIYTEKVQKAAKEYIEEHLDYFKEQAFTMMPEAKNATRIDIVDPSGLYDGGPSYTEFFPDNT